MIDKLSYCEGIWKWKFNLEKGDVLQIGAQNIKVECKLSNKTKKMN